MCGLIGATGKFESRYLVALGCLSESRGKDSAGVAWQVADRLRIAKIAQNPLVAYPVTLAPAIRHAAKYGGPLIGHTRAATMGVVSNENAHPFYDKESNIAWAHNGIISNYAKFGTFSVDSEALIVGIKKRDFSEFYGPIALLWLEEGKLHAFRKGNPLYRGVRREGVYLASEEDMLTEIGCKRVKELSEGHLYIWNQNTLEGARAIPFNKSYSTSAWSSGSSYYDGDYNERWNTRSNKWEKTRRRELPPMGGCSGGGTRQAGFHFTHHCPKGSGCPEKMEEEVSGLRVAAEVPAALEPGKASITETGQGTGTDESLRGDSVKEADTLVEADMLERGETLDDEIKEMEALCKDCQLEPKLSGDADLCAQCFNAYIIRNNYDH